MARKVVFFILIMVCIFDPAHAVNLLTNGDFESGTIRGHFTNGYPDGWGGWGQDGWHHSDAGLKKDNFGIAIWQTGTGCVQVIAASPGDTFSLSGEMIYTVSESLVNRDAVLEIEFWNGPDPTGVLISETQIGRLMPGHSADTWYTFSRSNVTAPAGTTEARIVCYVSNTGGGASGKGFWDNISVDNLQTINDPDYNNDLLVNFDDFGKLSGVWGQTSSIYNLAGGNLINDEDLTVFASAWNPTTPVYPGYEFLWSDEFNGPVINTANWTHEIGTGNWGWGNNEWEYYTDRPENSRIEDGKLVIEAIKEPYGGKNYTSARLTTQGKQSFQNGRIEARIKLPVGGDGIWPAFWMLGNNFSDAGVGWPACGELDILEMIQDPYTAIGAVHYGSSSDYEYDSYGYTTAVDLSDDFHIYAVEWDATEIRWYRDSTNFYTLSTWWSSTGSFPAPFNQPFFIILNFAVGADWMTEDPSVPFPQQMYIDYVRVYQAAP